MFVTGDNFLFISSNVLGYYMCELAHNFNCRYRLGCHWNTTNTLAYWSVVKLQHICFIIYVLLLEIGASTNSTKPPRIMASGIIFISCTYCYAECHNSERCYARCSCAECYYVDCHDAECHFPECTYTECRYPVT